jgi:hypothetical protein
VLASRATLSPAEVLPSTGRRTDPRRRAPSPLLRSPDPQQAAADFARDALARVGPVLAADSLAALAEECRANLSRAERSYIPTHKKGGTLSYERVHLFAPRSLAFYHSPELRAWVSQVVGQPVVPTADHDQSSCSILYYDQPGDHIHWHFDHNFYPGRHFTVLLSVVNRAGELGVSSGTLERRDADGQAVPVDTSENALVVFEGKRVRHRASPVEAGQTRIMLSMTFGTNPRIGWGWEMLRRVKDTAYFGPRALWE